MRHWAARHHPTSRRARRRIGVGIAVLGLLTGAVCAAAPASASSVTVVSFVPDSATAGATSSWTVGLTATTAIGQNSTIDMVFDSNITTSAAVVTLGARFSTAKCNLKSQKIIGQDVQATLAGGQCAISAGTAFTIQVAPIGNPTIAGSYGPSTFTVKTSSDTTPVPASAAVNIAAAAANKLAFTSSPSNANAGVAFTNQPTVAVQDQYGNLVTGSTAAVTIAVTAGTGTPTATLTCAPPGATRNAGNGIIGYTGCAMTTAGTNYTLTATSSGLTNAVSAQFTIAAAAANKLAFVQAPSDAFAGTAITPAVTVQVQDQYGNPTVTSTTINLAASSGTIDAGASAPTNGAGLATFTGITINTATPGLALTASASGLAPATSGPFAVTVKVTNAAAALADLAADAGSGMKSVAYYYCAGYTGTCTSTSGTLIGSSMNTAAGFPITWTSQPPNGAYRLVAVGTDNVGNINDASTSIPVTVSN